MNAPVSDVIYEGAWQKLLDPGSTPDDVTAAVAVLGSDHERLANKLAESPTRLDPLAPDRTSIMAQLAKTVRTARDWAGLASELRGTLAGLRRREHVWRRSCEEVQRAHGIVEILDALGRTAELDADDWEWLFLCDERAKRSFILPLAKWCIAHDPVPDDVVDVVTMLREDEVDSPILDRLAAWVAPSVLGMTDLACWENGMRLCISREYAEVARAWENGIAAPAELEAKVLGEIVDPDNSWNVGALQLALERNGEAARRALREAIETSDSPIVRRILGVWRERVQGAA